jgi:outer membrane protein OmpA-like peptidoglycan-associated protein
MLKKPLILVILSVMLPLGGVFSQENVEFKASNFPDQRSEFRSAKRNIRYGDNARKNQEKPEKALDYYLKAWEFNPNSADLNYKIGKTCVEAKQKQKALIYFEKAAELNPWVREDLLLWLGKSRHLNYKFDEAINAFNEYMKEHPSMSEEDRMHVQKYINECRNGIDLIKDTVDVEISNMGPAINTEYPEYNPMILADGSRLVFTARRKYIGNPIEPSDGKYCEDVWYSDKMQDSSWSDSKRFGSPINTNGHDAISGISTDGQKMYVYKPVNKQGGDIYYSVLEGDAWQKPKDLGAPVNSEYHESKVSLSYDGKKLYLVSNRPEGSEGGRDIWVCKRTPWDSWGVPENLGPVINTKYDEEGVLIHPDGRTLYFCSRGHNSMGGMDIFRSVQDTNGNWSAPENLGYPINTPDDEAFFSIAADGKHAYISSIRPDGFGDYDIYEVKFPERDSVEKAGQIEARLTLFTGWVKDAKTLDPLKASIEIVDNDKNEVVVELFSNESSGKFVASLPAGKNYGLSVNRDGYMFHSENFNIPDTAKFQKIEREILLQPMEVGTRIVLKNIFFDYDKASLREESFAELERVKKVLEDNPGIKIEISGHTDNRGSMEYNLDLSENRAKSVVDYLIEQGIDADRLKYKGYAFKQPIADNDTDEGRQLNRRVEFKVLENN